MTALTRRTALTLGGAVALVPVIGRAQEPGLLITGGPIYTGRGDGERVEAVVLRGDGIAFVGALDAASNAAPGARRIDLGGAGCRDYSISG